MKKLTKMGIGILCLMGNRLFSDNNSTDQSGNAVIIEENSNNPQPEVPYWMGPGVYDGIWFADSNSYYNYYRGHGYYDHDGNWQGNHEGDWNHDHGYEGGYHGGGHH